MSGEAGPFLRGHLEMRGLESVERARLDEVVPSQGNMEHFLGVEIDVAEAELDRAVRIWNPRFKNRHDGLTGRQNVRDGERPIPVGRGSPLRLQKHRSCQE